MEEKPDWLGLEKRRFPRAETRLPARAIFADPAGGSGEFVFDGMIVDVSHSGARLTLNEFLPEDTHDAFGQGSLRPIRLELRFPGETEEARLEGVITFLKFNRGKE